MSEKRASGTGLPYGYERVGHQIVDCAEEVRILQLVYVLRKYGHMPYQGIADLLNFAGFRTRRGNLWILSSVSELWRGPLDHGRRQIL